MKAQTYTNALGDLYVQPKHLTEKFSLGRTTVYRYLREMKKVPKYRKSFLDLSYHKKIVKLADFEKYLQEIDGQYLKK